MAAGVGALLRRTRLDRLPSAAPHVLVTAGLRLDLDQHTLTVDDRPVELTRTEFNLLHAFLEISGYTLTREDLLEKGAGLRLRGDGPRAGYAHQQSAPEDRAGPGNPTYIQTVYGVGYRMARRPA